MTSSEYKFYREADRILAGRPPASFAKTIKRFFLPDPLEEFVLLLRKIEYLDKRSGPLNKIPLLLAGIKFRKLSLKLGFSIPPGVFGPGLYIPHYGTIVINSNTRVGANCVLHTSSCIAGSEPKMLGDNVYISTGVIIAGSITLGNNVTVSANSYVNKSFDSNVLIGGSPAKILKERNAWYEHDDERFRERVKRIEALREQMFVKKT